MKKYLLTIIIFYCFCFSKGQGIKGFYEGLIIKKEGDTLNCLILRQEPFEGKVYYITYEDSVKKQSISTKLIKYILFPDKLIENIQMFKREVFATLIVDGDTKLYLYSEPRSNTNYHNKFSPYWYQRFYIKKNTHYYEISDDNYKSKCRELFSDCGIIIEEINKMKYKSEDLEKIVKEYNNCNNRSLINENNDTLNKNTHFSITSDEVTNIKYENGTLKDGFKEGVWEYYDIPGDLSLKIDYTSGRLLFLKPDTTDYVLQENGIWIKSKLDIQSRYLGSMIEFYNIINSNIKYPVKARENNTAGTVHIAFIIDTTGHATDFTAINDIGDGCAEIALQAMSHIPNVWLEASKDKRKYFSKYILPFTFKLIKRGKEITSKNNGQELPLAKLLDEVTISHREISTK